MNLNYVDLGIILVYFLILLGIGWYLKKRASSSLNDYFLAGKKMPWWALGMSSMASWLDMTGTMIIVSFLFLLGPRGLYIEFRGGACLGLIAIMLWAGKWHRRSNVMTGAEWMIYRFGNGVWGNVARLASVVATVVFSLGLLAYSFVGAGLFLSMFLPFSPLVCSIIMMVITTIYTLESGFYGVVVTDIFQSVCIWIGVAFIVTMTVAKLAGQDLSAVALMVTGNSDWTTTVPQWQTTMPKGYENYSLLWMVGGFYLLKSLIQGMGFGADPKYFGARTDKECGLLSFMAGWLMMLRWPLMLGFAVLGLFLIKDLFPDQNVLLQAAALIKQHVPNITGNHWADLIAGIANHPTSYSPDLINGLSDLLGSQWQSKLSLLSYEGTVNPELILPAVLLFNIPMGFRGLLIVALLAAAMSTFNSFINMTTGFLTKDLYQGYIRPKATNKELIYASYIFSVLQVIIALAMAYSTKSINDIWGWLTMGLAAGIMVPSILRLHWWRFNGCGFAVGTVAGLIAAILQRKYLPGMIEWQQFVYILAIGFLGSVFGTYLEKPVSTPVLENFYKTTRPFGLWKKFHYVLSPQALKAAKREHFYDIISVPFTLGWMVTILLMPMQLMIKAYTAFWGTFVIFAISMIGLYLFWYRNLSRLDQQEVTLPTETLLQEPDEDVEVNTVELT